MVTKKSLKEYIIDLDNPDPRIKVMALKKLGKAGPAASYAIPRIVPLLSDDAWKVRAWAARSLGYIGPQTDESILHLMNALDDEMATVRSDTAYALGRMGKKAALAVPMLRKSLSDPKWSVRISACDALGSLGPPAVSAVGELLKVIADADNFTERYRAWEAINAVLSNDVSLQTLLQHAGIEDMPIDDLLGVRATDRKTGKQLPSKKTVKRYLSELAGVDQKKKLAAMRNLSDVVCAKPDYMDTLIIPSVPEIIQLLSDESWKVRGWAARLLGRIGPKADAAAPHLAASLQDNMATVRECAAYALGLLGAKATASIPALEKALSDPSRSVRTSAHMSLRKLENMDGLLDHKTGSGEFVCYKIDDDELDIHYYVAGYREKSPECLGNTMVKTNRDIYLLVTSFETTYGDNPPSLEEYLRSLWRIVSQSQVSSPSLEQVAEWLTAAFTIEPPPFDPEWMKRVKDYSSSLQTQDDWENLILFQIADLRRMADAGQLEDEQRYYGIDSPSGERWYNFDPFTYLECGVRGALGGYEEDEVIVLVPSPEGQSANSPVHEIDNLGWGGFSAILECGRVYE
jgi:HEAT repeat protein